MIDPEKRAAIAAALEQNPTMSNRAIARLTVTSPSTVGIVRVLVGKANGQRFEASGRRARGRAPSVSYYEERLPDGSGVVYRCYSATGQLLYIGASLGFIRRLAQHSKRPWFADIAQVTLTHFADRNIAFYAERIAIREEKPKYNIVVHHDDRIVHKAALEAVRKAAAKPAPPVRKQTTRSKPPPPTPGRIRRPTGRIPV